MVLVRPATHSNSWYSGSSGQLSKQLTSYFSKGVTDKSRIVIGPHAGYTYSGERLGETFNALSLDNIKRVFILGPSHHVYFRNHLCISGYDYYSTPLGDLKVDKVVNDELNDHKEFKYMSEEIDDDEHSFEMHCPFLKHKMNKLGIDTEDVSIIPIMISHLDTKLLDTVSDILQPFFEDPTNAFVLSSDFCHWGSRFGYTEYLKEGTADFSKGQGTFSTLESSLISIDSKSRVHDIYKGIERLDRVAMDIMASGDYKDWIKYIKLTGNTICGQKPILVILKLLQLTNDNARFKWCGYSQSGKVADYYDSSVSYASGYI